MVQKMSLARITKMKVTFFIDMVLQGCRADSFHGPGQRSNCVSDVSDGLIRSVLGGFGRIR